MMLWIFVHTRMDKNEKSPGTIPGPVVETHIQFLLLAFFTLADHEDRTAEGC